MGIVEVTTGVMGASKSARAIADVKNLRFQGHRVLVIKPAQDTRDGDKIASRLINETIDADIIIEPDTMLDKQKIMSENYDCIVVDEIHMLEPYIIRQLYEISAMSDTDIHLYGLTMSWQGTPFMSTAMALAYADEIHKIKMVDKQKNVLNHHIRKVNGTPSRINCPFGLIEPGDLKGDIEYTSISKQAFYELYSMLGQIREDDVVPQDNDGDIPKIKEEEVKCEEKALPKGKFKIGDNVIVNERGKHRLNSILPIMMSESSLNQQFTITDIEEENGAIIYGIDLLLYMIGQVFLTEDELDLVE